MFNRKIKSDMKCFLDCVEIMNESVDCLRDKNRSLENLVGLLLQHLKLEVVENPSTVKLKRK